MEGYHAARFLWEVRGLLDKLVGGIGLRRGRRHPFELAVGEPVDFWRVEAFEPPHLLRLRAEMKVPGEAWLEYRVIELPGGSGLDQRARFHPRGLWGRIYWSALVPFHGLIFPRMAQELVREAERRAGVASEQPAVARPAPAAGDGSRHVEREARLTGSALANEMPSRGSQDRDDLAAGRRGGDRRCFRHGRRPPRRARPPR
jgi:hypothetical protein